MQHVSIHPKGVKSHHENCGDIFITTEKEYYNPGDEVVGYVNLRVNSPISNA